MDNLRTEDYESRSDSDLRKDSHQGVRRPTSLHAALSIVVYVDASTWIVGVVPTLYYACTQGFLPTLGGIKLLGRPFESVGLDTLIVAGIGYIIVSALKILAAYWIWSWRKDCAVLELILLGLSTL